MRLHVHTDKHVHRFVAELLFGTGNERSTKFQIRSSSVSLPARFPSVKNTSWRLLREMWPATFGRLIFVHGSCGGAHAEVYIDALRETKPTSQQANKQAVLEAPSFQALESYALEFITSGKRNVHLCLCTSSAH